MSFNREIDENLAQLQVLRDLFEASRNAETLPLSFFSASYDALKRLKSNLQQLEKAQQAATGHVFFGDSIVKKIYPDFRKSLTLNHRFMFKRDIFFGDTQKMDEAINQLNDSGSLNEAVEYLNANFAVEWGSDAGAALMDLLKNRFL